MATTESVRAALDGLKRFHECFAHLPPYDDEDERTFEENAEVIKLRETALKLLESLEPLMKGIEQPPDEYINDKYMLNGYLYYRGHVTPVADFFVIVSDDIKRMKTIEDIQYIFAFQTNRWERYLSWLLTNLA